MKYRTKTFFIFALTALLLAPSFARAEKITFNARVNRQKIGINETLQYILSVEGVGGRIQLPQPPPFNDFDTLGTSQSQSMQIINGRMSATFNLMVELLPRDTGKFTIPPATFKHKGTEYKSNPVTVEVVQGQKKPQTSAPQRMSPTLDPMARDRGVQDNLFFKASLNKSTAVVNEPVLLTFGLYNRIDIYGGNLSWPNFSGFWSEMLTQEEEVRETIVDGKRYMVREWNFMLFPTTTGTFTIQEATLETQLNPFGGGYQVKTNPVTIKVVDYPEEGKPDDFDGAVGRYDIKAELSPTQVQVNESTTLTVIISGTGNVDSISELNFDFPPDIDVYESSSNSEKYKADDYVHGKRTFEYVLLPRAGGNYEINPVSFSFYDYRDKKYITVSTKPLSLKVEGGTGEAQERMQVAKESVTLLKREINHIKPIPPGGLRKTVSLITSRPYLAAHLVFPFLLLGALLMRRRRDRFRTDVALARSTRAKGFAAKKLRKARGFMKADTQQAFFAELSTALAGYFADKMNRAASSLVTEELIRALEDRMGDAAPSDDIRDCFITCDTARFSTFGIGMDDMKKAYDQAAGIINTVERNWR